MPIRSVKPLNTKLERNLANYALAAGATGVGLLGLGRPAQAKVVYTPAHVRLETGGLHHYALDINHDGFPEFFLDIASHSNNIWLYATEANYGYRIQRDSLSLYPVARKTGGRIGPDKLFDGGNRDELMAVETSQGGLFGPWVNIKSRYLGLQMTTDGTRYGWARLNVQFGKDHTMHATLTGYAYETIPNRPIVAGDEGTGTNGLGHLALGAAGRKQHLQRFLARH